MGRGGTRAAAAAAGVRGRWRWAMVASRTRQRLAPRDWQRWMAVSASSNAPKESCLQISERQHVRKNTVAVDFGKNRHAGYIFQVSCLISVGSPHQGGEHYETSRPPHDALQQDARGQAAVVDRDAKGCGQVRLLGHYGSRSASRARVVHTSHVVHVEPRLELHVDQKTRRQCAPASVSRMDKTPPSCCSSRCTPPRSMADCSCSWRRRPAETATSRPSIDGCWEHLTQQKYMTASTPQSPFRQ